MILSCRYRCLTRVARFASLCFATSLHAQAAPGAPTPRDPSRSPRVAVVLSGGGAKGIAHIGVLQVLESEGISPQIVTGTSMGALVGGLYAMGYSPASLDSLVRGLDWPSYFSDASSYSLRSIDRRRAGEKTLISVPMKRWRPTLPSGAITGQRISRLLSSLTWPAQTTRNFRELPRAFVAVATDIETGDAVVLDHGSLAQAMRASMSLPSIFEPVRLDGRLLVDGGIVRNLPASDARALGAEIVICSDVADPLLTGDNLRSLADVLMQTITFQMNTSTVQQQKLCDINIRPDITGLTAADFGRAADIVARGTVAAEAIRAGIRALGAAQPSRIAAPRHAAWSDSIHSTKVVIDGLTGRAALRARRALELPVNGWHTAASLDSAVQRAYATDLYDRVQYRIDIDGPDTAIVVTAVSRSQDRAGIGFRFDDTYKASILFTAVVRNWLGTGSTTEFDLRLGEQLKLAVEHISTSVQNPRYAFGGGASAVRTPLPIYVGGQRIAEASLSVGTARLFTGATIGRHGGIGVELTGEASGASSAIAVTDTSRRDAFGSVAVLFAWDAIDRPTYPRHGYALSGRSEYAAGTTRFMQHVARARIAQPLVTRFTLLLDGTVGMATRGDALPLHRLFQLGGVYPSVLFSDRQVAFAGLRPVEQLGTSVVRAGAAVQWEVRRESFATIRTNTGYAGNVLTIDGTRYHTGLALSLGTVSPLGQVEVTASAQDRRGGTRIELNIGRMF